MVSPQARSDAAAGVILDGSFYSRPIKRPSHSSRCVGLRNMWMTANAAAAFPKLYAGGSTHALYITDVVAQKSVICGRGEAARLPPDKRIYEGQNMNLITN
jgi:hypothetical protein